MSQLYLYRPVSQIRHLYEGATQSVQKMTHSGKTPQKKCQEKQMTDVCTEYGQLLSTYKKCMDPGGPNRTGPDRTDYSHR